MEINTLDEYFDELPMDSKKEIVVRNNRTPTAPIVSIVIGQGLNKIIRPGYIEFTTDIICQKIILKGINCNPADYSFFIECINGGNVNCMNIHSGDTISMKRVNWFSETKYRLMAYYSGSSSDSPIECGIESIVAEFSISWPSRSFGPNAKSDIVSLIVIQSDPEVSLPKRAFWYLWSRIGTGIIDILDIYRETGQLPAMTESGGNPTLFRGIRSVLEHGNEYQIQTIVYAITSISIEDPKDFKNRVSGGVSGKKMTESLEIDSLVRDMNIIYGYEYLINDEFLLNFSGRY